MAKIDYKKEFKEFYLSSAKESKFVDLQKLNYLMIDGKGDPFKMKVIVRQSAGKK